MNAFNAGAVVAQNPIQAQTAGDIPLLSVEDLQVHFPVPNSRLPFACRSRLDPARR